MKHVLLMTRNEGSDHIIEALMEHDDVHVVLEVAGAVDDAPACGELLDAEEHALNPRSRQAPAHSGATIRRDLNI